MNFQSVNVEHNFSAVCVCYAYAGMFYLLSIYRILLFCGTYSKERKERVKAGKVIVD